MLSLTPDQIGQIKALLAIARESGEDYAGTLCNGQRDESERPDWTDAARSFCILAFRDASDSAQTLFCWEFVRAATAVYDRAGLNRSLARTAYLQDIGQHDKAAAVVASMLARSKTLAEIAALEAEARRDGETHAAASGKGERDAETLTASARRASERATLGAYPDVPRLNGKSPRAVYVREFERVAALVWSAAAKAG